MAELDKAIERLQKAAKAQDKLTTGVVTEVGRNRRRLNAVETQGNDHGRRLDEHDDAIARVHQRATDIQGDVAAMATVVDNTANRVDTHTQQIETHDNWFNAIFNRLGPEVLWGRLIAFSVLIGFISCFFWYFGVFEQFGLEKHFVDPITNRDFVIPAETIRMLIITIGMGVATAAGLAILLSFLWVRVTRQTAAEPAPAAAAVAAPTPAEPAAPPVVIIEELPPPPAAPAPATEPAPAPPVPVA